MELEYKSYVAHKRLLEETLRAFPARKAIWLALETNAALPTSRISAANAAVDAVLEKIEIYGQYTGGDDEDGWMDYLCYLFPVAETGNVDDAVYIGIYLADYLEPDDMLLEYARQRELLRFLADTDTFAPGDRARFPMPPINELE